MNKYWTIAVVIFGTILIIFACSDIGRISTDIPTAETTAGETGRTATSRPSTPQATTRKETEMKQLQVFNPNTCEWWEVTDDRAMKGHTIVNESGTGTRKSAATLQAGMDNALTPLPATSKYAKWMQLGQAMWEFVQPEHRSRITCEVRIAEVGEWTADSKGGAFLMTAKSRVPRIILTPEPEPKPKTHREVIQDLVDAWDTPKERVMGVINPAFDAAKKHLVDTADRKEQP